MKEKDLNTVINNSFKCLGFSHKISDPMGGQGSQNPFDGFSVCFDQAWYWESKLIKEGYYAFNFNKIEEHQWGNLLRIKKEMPTANCVIIVGFWASRSFFEYLVFDVVCLWKMKNQGQKSIKKTELEKLRKKGYNMIIKKNKNTNKLMTENMEAIQNKIITCEVLQHADS